MALAVAAAGNAGAQYYSGGRNSPRGQSGVFDYYVMSLSWSPTFCAGLPQSGAFDPQCNRRGGRPYAFVLHGLWPQYERGFPQSCATRESTYLPQPIINRMLDIMPSSKLAIHEWKTHGVCSGLNADRYFDLARKLYGGIKIPAAFASPASGFTVSPADVVKEFVAANPQLRPDMIAVTCGGSGNRMREVRVCFGKDGNFRTCGSNENQRRLCNADKMYVPPIRG
jgi:ribonuclease T2